MDEIYTLYERAKEHAKAFESIKVLQDQNKNLEEEINDLELKLKIYDSKEKKRIEKELKDISRKLKKLELFEKDELSIEDLKVLLYEEMDELTYKKVVSSVKCKVKFIKFSNTGTDISSEDIWIKIDRDILELEAIKDILIEIFTDLLKNQLLSDIKILTNGQNYFIRTKRRVKDPLENFEFINIEPCPIPYLIQKIAEQNLIKNIIQGEWTLDEIEKNTKRLNPREWVVDVLMKEIIKCARRQNPMTEIENELITKEAAHLNCLIQKVRNINSKRTAKINETIEKALIRFCTIEKVEKSLYNYILLFNDINFFLQNYNVNQLNHLRDKLFEEIIYISKPTQKDFEKSIEQVITNIEKKIDYFNELIDFLQNKKNALNFKICLSNTIFHEFIDFIFSKTEIYTDEISDLNEIALFLIKKCYIRDKTEMYEKMESLIKILTFNLDQIVEAWMNESIYFTKSEVIELIKKIFEDNDKRRISIYKIRNF